MGNLLEIRKIEASETWDLRHRVMWADKPLDYVKLPNDSEGIHFGLFKNDKLVSVVSLFIVNNKAQFRKLATEIAEQGQGYASKLLARLMQEAEKQQITKIWCNARVDKTKFYQKFGMYQTDKVFTKGGIDYVIMEKQL